MQRDVSKEEFAVLFVEHYVMNEDDDCVFISMAWCFLVFAAVHGKKERATEQVCACLVF